MGVSICSDRELRVIDKGGKRGKNMEIGNKIKEARNGAELTQDQAAEKIMVSRQTISNWETGKTMPDIASVIKMSDLYHISLDELLKGDQDMMKKIEKDTNIVRSNSRLIAVGIVAIIVAVVVTFASIMTGNWIFLRRRFRGYSWGLPLRVFLQRESLMRTRRSSGWQDLYLS